MLRLDADVGKKSIKHAFGIPGFFCVQPTTQRGSKIQD